LTISTPTVSIAEWGKAHVLIGASDITVDGQPRKSALLASRWWGVARHFHESFPPWFYLVFLTILRVDRAGRDEQRCAAGYGAEWNRYREAVLWRMPGV
jgi:7-dehydrocholesterol reductase